MSKLIIVKSVAARPERNSVSARTSQYFGIPRHMSKAFGAFHCWHFRHPKEWNSRIY